MRQEAGCLWAATMTRAGDKKRVPPGGRHPFELVCEVVEVTLDQDDGSTLVTGTAG